MADDLGDRATTLAERPLPPLPVSMELWQAIAAQLDLSPQHARVIELVLRGLGDKQIAIVMQIHKSTLRTYLDRISVRIGARGRNAILRKVLEVSHEIRQ